MACTLTIVGSKGERYEFELTNDDLSGFDAQQARDWLGREFDSAGCVPTHPVGKLLLADKILCLAKTQDETAYVQLTHWSRTFIRAAAVAIGRPVLTVDLATHSLGY